MLWAGPSIQLFHRFSLTKRYKNKPRIYRNKFDSLVNFSDDSVMIYINNILICKAA